MTSQFAGGSLPLAGLSVVEVTGIESVAYTGVLLGTFGAAVVKIEPPGGDPVRRRPPLYPATSGEPISAAFEFLNAGKSSLLADEIGADVIGQRIAAADIVVVDQLALLECGVELGARRPGQLRVFVGAYGGAVDVASPSSPLTRLHAGTSGYIIPADRDMTTRPGWSGPYVFEAMHGVGLALAIVAERQRSAGADIDYSLQAYGVWLEKLLFSRTSMRGIDFHRDSAVYPYGGNMTCRDGYAAIFVIEERQWRGFAAMIGHPEWVADPRFADGVLRSTNREPIAAALEQWCAERTVDEVTSAGRAHDVPMGRVRRPSDVLSSEVLLDRDFFQARATPGGPLRVPGLPLGPDARGRVDQPAPILSPSTSRP